MSYTLDKFFKEAKVPEYPDWFSEITLRHRKIKDFAPRWEQITGLNLMFAHNNYRSGLFDAMGSGKTVPAQAFCLWHAAYKNKVLCLMPRSLLLQFQESLFATYEGVDKKITCEIYHGTPKQRDAQIARWEKDGSPDITLTTYGMMMKEGPIFNHFGCSVLLMDEAKILASPESKTYKAIERFMGKEGQKYAVVLNGTPSGNTLRDLYGNIKFITPTAYKGQREFDAKHVVYQRIPVQVGKHNSLKIRDVDIIDSYRNLNLLTENLYLQARRIEKSSMKLPPLTETEISIDLSPRHKKIYDQFIEERLLEFTNGEIIDGTSSAALRQTAFQSVVRPDVLGLNEKSALLELYDTIIDGVGITETKVFIMAHYQKTVELLKEHFKKYNPAVIYGKTSNPAKERKKFLEDDTCRIMIINYEAGGVGLDGLQDVCYTGICAEPTTVPRAYDQARDRLHRGGQTNPVQIYLPKPRGTIFVKAIKSLQDKKDWISAVVSVDSMRDELSGIE